MNEKAWDKVATGIMWMLILLGIGGCSALCRHPSGEPMITIKTVEPSK